MSWRFRRVISAGLLRLNLSRRGIGWSVGIPGMRYGRSAMGAPYVSLGFPGLGLSWFKYLRDSRSSERQITSTTSSEPNRTDQ
jgi:hypothetical protein